jgi:multisubunit Na+/H+ antiporter MnhF subunit
MFHSILLVLMVLQGLFLLATMVYIATSLHFEDRIVGTNLVGTIVINFITMLSVFMNEGYGMDIALVYGWGNMSNMVNQLAVNNDSNFASAYASNESKILAELAKSMEWMGY